MNIHTYSILYTPFRSHFINSFPNLFPLLFNQVNTSSLMHRKPHAFVPNSRHYPTSKLPNSNIPLAPKVKLSNVTLQYPTESQKSSRVFTRTAVRQSADNKWTCAPIILQQVKNSCCHFFISPTPPALYISPHLSKETPTSYTDPYITRMDKEKAYFF